MDRIVPVIVSLVVLIKTQIDLFALLIDTAEAWDVSGVKLRQQQNLRMRAK